MKVLPFVLIAIGFAAILTMALVARSTRLESAPTRRTALGEAVAKSGPSGYDTYAPANAALPPPASDVEGSRAIHESSIRSTLFKYRTAVVSGSRRTSESLLCSLKKNEELAVRIAEEDLRRAKTEAERRSIQNALEAIRR